MSLEGCDMDVANERLRTTPKSEQPESAVMSFSTPWQEDSQESQESARECQL